MVREQQLELISIKNHAIRLREQYEELQKDDVRLRNQMVSKNKEIDDVKQFYDGEITRKDQEILLLQNKVKEI